MTLVWVTLTDMTRSSVESNFGRCPLSGSVDSATGDML